MNTPRRGGGNYGPPDETQPLPLGDGSPNAAARGSGPARWRRLGRGARWTAAVAAAAAIAGASVLGVSLASGGSASGVNPRAASSALTMNAAVQVAAASASAASGAGQPASVQATGSGEVRAAGARACIRSALRLRMSGRFFAARARFRACLRRYPRLRFLLRLRAIVRHSEHGQVTFGTKNGPRTLVFERGVITSASSGSVVVKAADGTVWTWDVTSSTVLTSGGQRVTAGALKSGRAAVLVGLLTGGSNDARRIFVMS